MYTKYKFKQTCFVKNKFYLIFITKEFLWQYIIFDQF